MWDSQRLIETKDIIKKMSVELKFDSKKPNYATINGVHLHEVERFEWRPLKFSFWGFFSIHHSLYCVVYQASFLLSFFLIKGIINFVRLGYTHLARLGRIGSTDESTNYVGFFLC